MLDELIAFLLSLGILGALVAWGLVCNVWHRQMDSENAPSAEPFREGPAQLAEWWNR